MNIPQNTRAQSKFFTINGTPILEPDHDVKVTHESLADSESGRTRDGVMHINWVRTDLRKFELRYSYLTSDEYESLYARTQGKIFTWGFWEGAVQRSMQAYCSNLSYSTYYVNPNTKKGLYQDLAFSVIEI